MVDVEAAAASSLKSGVWVGEFARAVWPGPCPETVTEIVRGRTGT